VTGIPSRSRASGELVVGSLLSSFGDNAIKPPSLSAMIIRSELPVA
jgi:hypothetical protein